MKAVRYVAVAELPGGMPAATVERDGVLMIYLSRAYDLAVVTEGLSAAVGAEVRRSWVHMGALAEAAC